MAGLPITARTNHALYISHYPLGRDATVDYPDIDLKFVNDTGHWLLLRTFVGPSSLVVTLYGTPQHRRVVTNTAPLVQTAPMPIERTLDRALAPGTSVIESYGEPAYSTSVQRLVYAPGGKLLSNETWYSNYRSLPELVEVGPQPKPVQAEAEAEAGRPGGYDACGSGGVDPAARLGRAAVPAIAARSHSGVRVGRRRGRVDRRRAPSSRRRSRSPRARSAYSKRNRAPRRSRQRVCTSSRSSKTAGARKRTCASSTSDSIPWSRRRW